MHSSSLLHLLNNKGKTGHLYLLHFYFNI